MIQQRQIGPDLVTLEATDDGHRLCNRASGVVAELGSLEAIAFLRCSDQRIEEYFAERGGLGAGSSSDLAVAGVGLSHGLPVRDLLACWMDTTTIQNAVKLVEGALPVTPAGMLDLATLVFAVLFHDQVAVDDEMAALPDALESIMVRQGLRNEHGLHRHYGYAAGTAGSSALDGSDVWTEVRDSWRDLLGQTVDVDYRLVDSRTDSPGRWPYLPGGTFGFGWDPIATITAAEQGRVSTSGLSADVSIQTYRYLVNERTAERFGIPYFSSSLRYPVERVAVRRRSEFRQLADATLNTLFGRPDVEDVQDGAYLRPVRLPQPLGLVLHECSTRREFWDVLLQYRDRLVAVREWMRENRDEFGGMSALRDLRRRLGAEATHPAVVTADHLFSSASSIAAVVPTDPVVAGVMLKAASTVRPIDQAVRLVDRIRRPELHILRSLRSEAEGLQASAAEVHRLWGERLDAAWMANAVRLGAAGAVDARRLRS